MSKSCFRVGIAVGLFQSREEVSHNSHGSFTYVTTGSLGSGRDLDEKSGPTRQRSEVSSLESGRGERLRLGPR